MQTNQQESEQSAGGAYAGKDYFIFSAGWVDLLKMIESREEILALLEAIRDYMLGTQGEEGMSLSATGQIAFRMIRQDADRMTAYYRKKKARAGAKAAKDKADGEASRESGKAPSAGDPGRGRRYGKPEPVRYGTFDPQEAMQRAIARSFAELEDEEEKAAQ